MAVTTGSQQLLEFIKFLRGRDVPISPADSMDAVHAASLLGYADRSALRDGLAAVLAKSPFEESRYHEAFEIFFGLPESRSPENQIPPKRGAKIPRINPHQTINPAPINNRARNNKARRLSRLRMPQKPSLS